jgi:hypothetical protein
MPKQPAAEDAHIIMQLYDLRREAEMRKARTWFANFWPTSADDVLEVIRGGGTQENAWLRQVSGYWDMAASFVLRGAVHEELFFDSGAEMWFVLSKVYPFLQEIRQKGNVPHYFVRIENVATRTQEGRERLQMMSKRADAMRVKSAQA